jgi:hypothetical protein
MNELKIKEKELIEQITDIEIKVTSDLLYNGANSDYKNWNEAERLLRIRGKLDRALTEIKAVIKMIENNANK